MRSPAQHTLASVRAMFASSFLVTITTERVMPGQNNFVGAARKEKPGADLSLRVRAEDGSRTTLGTAVRRVKFPDSVQLPAGAAAGQCAALRKELPAV